MNTPSTSALSRNVSSTSQGSKESLEDQDVVDSDSADDDDSDDLNQVDRMRYFGSVKGILKTLKSYAAGPSTPPLSTQQRPEYWSTHKNLEEDSYIDPYVDQDFGDERLYMLLVEIYFEKVNSTLPLLNKKRFVADIKQRKL